MYYINISKDVQKLKKLGGTQLVQKKEQKQIKEIEAKKMTVKDQLKPIVEKIINQVNLQTQSAKSIALDQAWKILQLVLAQLIQSIEEIGNELSGSDKKTIVLDLLSGFYDKVFLVVDIPFVPGFLEVIIHKHVKNLLMILAGSSIDALVTTFRNIGVFIDPKNKVDPSHDSQPKISEK